jgi:hypothetical protein
MIVPGVVSLALVVLAAVYLEGVRPDSAKPATVARVVDVDDGHAEDTFTPGQELAPGRVEVISGKVHTQTQCGAELRLIGPAAIDLLDAKAVRLLKGRLTVDAPDAAVGFRVLTPTADMVDLGTEFGVEVTDDGATEVHVFDGVVAARPLGASGVVPIHESEAGRIGATVEGPLAMPGELVAIELNPLRFGASRPASRVPRLSGPASPQPDGPTPPLPPGSRIVFLGDKATSHETHLLLINQALRDLPDEMAPQLYNAAIAFEMQFTEEQFEQYIIAYRPTHAVIEFGSDIAPFTNAPTAAGFQRRLMRLLDRLEDAGVEPILQTGYPLPGGTRHAQRLLAAYNSTLRQVAVQRQYRLADVASRMTQTGGEAMVHDRTNIPTHDGYRLIADCLLEAMGYPGAKVPGELQLDLLPGVIRDWKYRLLPEEEKLSPEEAGSLEPDDAWLDLNLPQEDRFNSRLAHPSHSFGYQCRVRGFARHLYHGDAAVAQAIAYLHADEPREVFLNTGASLKTIWLNGQKIFDIGDRWTGWQPGKERVPARLKEGKNTIIVESGNSFFLSVTDARDWPLPR